MKTRNYLICLISLCTLQACSESSDNPPESECQGTECCQPECGPNQTCVQNECKPVSAECNPKCTDNQTCIDNVCRPQSTTECIPECKENQACVDGQCISTDPDACTGKLCKDNKTFCNKEEKWESCPTGTGCHLGFCLEGLDTECTDNTCSEDNRKICKEGVWFDCGSKEECRSTDNAFTPACVITDEACQPNQCSEDNAYWCNESGKWKKCSAGYECSESGCVSSTTAKNALLWTLCQVNSNCSYGTCLKELTPSKPLKAKEYGVLEDSEKIPLSVLDPRIPKGYGLCTADCSFNASVCDQLSTNTIKYTCQIVLNGDSPYPTKDENAQDIQLPFSHLFIEEDMQTAPYAAICRPNDVTHQNYTDSFCQSCSESSECQNGENCIYGMCLKSCSENDQCPAFFECGKYKDTDESFCMPKSGTCGDCLDRDNDGQGFGHCQKQGIDCDDTNPEINYTGQLPVTCSDAIEDKNCNGKVDYYELIGSQTFCSDCKTSCPVDDQIHLTSTCAREDEEVELDDSTIQSLRDTYQFQCTKLCAPGWADCNGDIYDGCEVQLVDFSEDKNSVSTLKNGAIYAVDNDEDGYAVSAVSKHIYCCPDDSNSKACYALPGSDAAPDSAFWTEVKLPNDGIHRLKLDVDDMTKLQDCDDSHSTVYPGAKEICDGLKNNCDKADNCNTENNDNCWEDGLDEEFWNEDPKGNKPNTPLHLSDNCSIYSFTADTNTINVCGSGKVACVSTGDAQYQMRCISMIDAQKSEREICEETWNDKDEENKKKYCESICKEDDKSCSETCQNAYITACLCNGIDDNCNGYVDEDWTPSACIIEENVGICQKGILTCSSNTQPDPESGDHYTTTDIQCLPLFTTPRNFDFFGDGIDSNCDGEDFNKKETLFVTPYFGSGTFEPHNDGTGHQKPGTTGLYNDPFVSLKSALEAACTKETSFTDSSQGLVITPNSVKCKDILINQTTGSIHASDWQNTISIPVYEDSLVYKPVFKSHQRIDPKTGETVEVNTWTHDELVAEYQRYQNTAEQSHSTSQFDITQYLLEEEKYPTELIRLYGGMEMKEEYVTDEIQGKDYSIPVWTQTQNRTKYAMTVNYKLAERADYSYLSKATPSHSLIAPRNTDTFSNNAHPSMSLLLNSMEFSISGSLETPTSAAALAESNIYKGVTLVGLQCGNDGCRHLTFENTTMDVSAPDGAAAPSDHDENKAKGWKSDGLSSMPIGQPNDIWDAKMKNGVDAQYWRDPEWNEVHNYLESYKKNACLSPDRRDKRGISHYSSWAEYYTEEDPNFKGYCPDGTIPMGGCAGVRCTKGNCQELDNGGVSRNGKRGWPRIKLNDNFEFLGGEGGAGYSDPAEHYSPAPVCAPKYNGKDGSNGKAGEGGKVFDIYKTMKLTHLNADDKFYVESDPSQGNGKAGISGYGGGGGTICHNYSRTGADDIWLYAGSGGSGGCGGWPGIAGGTGGSAIGIVLTPPKDSKDCIITPPKIKPFVTTTAGSGGNGQNGQLGIVGGKGGKGLQFDSYGHTLSAAPGGNGGIGGSSGGGSAGVPGASFTFIFACNRSEYSENMPFTVKDSTHPNAKDTCGFVFNGSLATSENNSFGKAVSKNFGNDGSNAKETANGTPGNIGNGGTLDNSNSHESISDGDARYYPLNAVYYKYYYLE